MDRAQAILDLGESDKEILRALYRFGFLETSQVGRLFGDLSLETLQKAGFLARIVENNPLKEPPVARTFWFLEAFGLRVVEEMEGVPRERRAKKSDSILQVLFLEHFRQTCEIYVELELLRRRGYLDILQWRGQRESRLEFPSFKSGGRGVLTPDATLTIGREGKLAAYFLEVDRATMALSRIREKLDRYREMYIELDRPEELLFLTEGAGRRDGIQNLLAEKAVGGRALLFTDALGYLAYFPLEGIGGHAPKPYKEIKDIRG